MKLLSRIKSLVFSRNSLSQKANGFTRVAVFQQEITVPELAEQFSFNSIVYRPYIPGKMGGNILPNNCVVYTCLKCETVHYAKINHGDTFLCDCGLYLQVHGNSAKVWQ